MPAPERYSTLQIWIHWIVAALVFFQLFVNEGMQEAFRDRLGGVWAPGTGAVLHIVAGLTVLALAIVRTTLRLTRGAPPAHPNAIVLVTWIGYATHLLLYGFIFFMPISGAIAWFAGVESVASLHELGRLVLVPAIGLHVLGGLAENFVFGNPTLQRMFGRADTPHR
jgi:cytochrome b561